MQGGVHMKKLHFMYFLIFPISFILIPVIVAVCFAKAPSSLAAGAFGSAFINAPVKNSESVKTIRVLDIGTGTVSEVNLEDYLPGVVAAEMPASYEPEALKAQAVAARSYILSKTDAVSPNHPEADVCNNPDHCKARLSENAAKEKWPQEQQNFYWQKINNAVRDTRGEYMVYGDEVVEAFFFAGSGGKTESSSDVWGGDRPYLQSVSSEGDIYSPNYKSTVTVSVDDFWNKLCSFNSQTLRSDGTPVIGEIIRTEGGSVASVCIGGQKFKGTSVRSIFGLKSANFTIDPHPDNVVFNVSGYGHGVGMSQFGANYMAQNGKKYTEILSHYYTNIQIVKN